MRRKPLLIGLVVLLLALVAGAWWLKRGQAEAEERDAPTAAEKRRAVVKKKMAARADLDLDPVRATGTVTERGSGKPIAGAIVLLSAKAPEGGAAGEPGEPAEPLFARTDVGGTWTLANVKPGRYTLSASADGFVPARNTKVRLPSEGPLNLGLAPGGQPVTGTVSDIGGGPIEGVLVQVVRMDDTNLIDFAKAPSAAVTDADGNYRMHLPDGTFIASAHHVDYVDKADATFDIAGKPKTLDFQLVPGARIEGVVLRRGSDEPVPGAIVVANGASASKMTGGFRVGGIGQHRVISDEQGRFAMSGLGSGVFAVSATGEGGATTSPTEVSLGIAETQDGVKVYVEPAFKISGFVVPRGKAEDDGLEGVWVGALSLRPPGLTVATGPSESDGYFEILGVQPGSYMVAALGEDRLPNIMGTSAEVVDEDVTDVLVEMSAGVVVSGRVNPAKPAVVKLAVAPEGMSLSTMVSAIGNAFVRNRTDENGTFELSPVAPGTLEVVAEADDGSRGKVTVEVGDEGAQNVVIDLAPRAAVSGTVVDTDGNAVGDARVSLKRVDGEKKPFEMSFSVNDNPMFGGGSPTRDDGTFVAKGLEPGKYQVKVSPKRGAHLQLVSGEQTKDHLDLEVPESGVEGLQLHVEARTGVITGVVKDADGGPIADAWVTAHIEGGGSSWMEDFVEQRRGPSQERIEARKRQEPKDSDAEAAGVSTMDALAAEPPVLTDRAGRFEIKNLRDGSYTLVAEAERGMSRARATGVAPGGSAKLTVGPMAGIDGAVKAKGKVVKRFTVTATGPNSRGTNVVDEEGQFTIERLDPGTYKVTIECDEGVGTEEVEVEAGGRGNVDFDLEGWGTIKGRVVKSSSGDPIMAASVMAMPEDGGGSVSDAMGMLLGGGPRTGGDGRFEITRVKPGKGTLTVLDRDATAGGALAAVSYEVKAGEELDLGDISGLDSGTVDAADRGDLGLSATAATWAKRPLPPLADGEQPDPDQDDADPPDGDAERQRLFVRSVTKGGPADTAGVVPGDEIISIDGRGVAGLGAGTADGLLSRRRIKAGQTVALELQRDGTGRRVTITATAD